MSLKISFGICSSIQQVNNNEGNEQTQRVPSTLPSLLQHPTSLLLYPHPSTPSSHHIINHHITHIASPLPTKPLLPPTNDSPPSSSTIKPQTPPQQHPSTRLLILPATVKLPAPPEQPHRPPSSQPFDQALTSTLLQLPQSPRSTTTTLIIPLKRNDSLRPTFLRFSSSQEWNKQPIVFSSRLGRYSVRREWWSRRGRERVKTTRTTRSREEGRRP
ncbi:hypothetical protein BDY24DRAFT_386476 [Mrakia frigida]|uniref:uncharacterized protein n=1 Tax=Mrakia frigida TaxID=29902 RepID=UPI003FCBEFEC